MSDTIQLRYDLTGCWATYKRNGKTIATAYAYKYAGTWEQCTAQAVGSAKEGAANYETPPPDGEIAVA